MGRRHYKVEEIIHKLREAEVHIANGKSVVEASRQIGIAEQSLTSADFWTLQDYGHSAIRARASFVMWRGKLWCN